MILCNGEALIDMLPRETTLGEHAFAPYAGGAVFNTAIALGRLGAPAGFFAGIAQDFFGDLLMDGLAASNVDTRFCIRSDRPSTVAFVQFVDGHAKYAFYDENTAGRMLAATDLPELDQDVDAMFFGGISLAVDPCGATYEALMLREAPNRVTMIDPNIRPGFIRDEDAYRGRIDRMIAAADIVKLSDEDMRWILGPGEIADLAPRLLTMGPAVVFVTEGATGAHAFTARGHVFHPSRKVQVVDTVGAGDTFNAGVLAALSQRGLLDKTRLTTLEDDVLTAVLKLGIDAAAITVSRAGANPPWAHELA